MLRGMVALASVQFVPVVQQDDIRQLAKQRNAQGSRQVIILQHLSHTTHP